MLDKLVHADGGDTLAWQARVDEIACLRQTGDFEAASRRIVAIDAAHTPPSVALAVKAEEISLFIDVGDLLTAGLMAANAWRDSGGMSPQLDDAILTAILDVWQEAVRAGKPDADGLREQAVTIVRQIEQRHAPYWAYHAEALLASRIVASPTTGDTAELVRAAESFYRLGKLDEALATYDKAIDQARANGRLDETFAPTMAAAAIEQQKKRYADAARRLRSIALEQPRHEKAAAAHLSAIYNTAQCLSSAQPSELDEYVAMLDEHLRLWPGGPTADRARLWLGASASDRRLARGGGCVWRHLFRWRSHGRGDRRCESLLQGVARIAQGAERADDATRDRRGDVLRERDHRRRRIADAMDFGAARRRSTRRGCGLSSRTPAPRVLNASWKLRWRPREKLRASGARRRGAGWRCRWSRKGNMPKRRRCWTSSAATRRRPCRY